MKIILPAIAPAAAALTADPQAAHAIGGCCETMQDGSMSRCDAEDGEANAGGCCKGECRGRPHAGHAMSGNARTGHGPDHQ